MIQTGHTYIPYIVTSSEIVKHLTRKYVPPQMIKSVCQSPRLSSDQNILVGLSLPITEIKSTFYSRDCFWYYQMAQRIWSLLATFIVHSRKKKLRTIFLLEYFGVLLTLVVAVLRLPVRQKYALKIFGGGTPIENIWRWNSQLAGQLFFSPIADSSIHDLIKWYYHMLFFSFLLYL